MIGSQSKRRQFEKRLEARGVPRDRLARMTCPIGISGVTGKEPEVIAIAVAAEMLQIRCRMGNRIGDHVGGEVLGQPTAADNTAPRRRA